MKIFKRKPKTGMFGRLKSGLAKTRRAIGESVTNALLGQKEFNQGYWWKPGEPTPEFIK